MKDLNQQPSEYWAHTSVQTNAASCIWSGGTRRLDPNNMCMRVRDIGAFGREMYLWDLSSIVTEFFSFAFSSVRATGREDFDDNMNDGGAFPISFRVEIWIFLGIDVNYIKLRTEASF